MEREPTEVERYELLEDLEERIAEKRMEQIFGDKDILNFEFENICHVTNNYTEIILSSLFPFYKGDIIQLTKKYDNGYMIGKEPYLDPKKDPEYVLRCEVIENVKRGIFSKRVKVRPKKLFHIEKESGGHSIINTLIFIYLRGEHYTKISEKDRHEVVCDYDDFIYRNGNIRYLYQSLDSFNEDGFPCRTGFSGNRISHYDSETENVKLELIDKVKLFDNHILWVTPDGEMASFTKPPEPFKELRRGNHGRLA